VQFSMSVIGKYRPSRQCQSPPRYQVLTQSCSNSSRCGQDVELRCSEERPGVYLRHLT
jgi:hypothetical protein